MRLADSSKTGLCLQCIAGFMGVGEEGEGGS